MRRKPIPLFHPDPRATTKQKIQHFELLLEHHFGIPEPPANWQQIGLIRDLKGLNKYPIHVLHSEQSKPSGND